MFIVGWILWGLTCVLAAVILRVTVRELRGEVAAPYKASMGAFLLEALTLGGVVGSLYMTVGRGVSKMHLLWLVPASFAAANLVGGPIIAIGKRMLLKRMFQEAAARFQGQSTEQQLTAQGEPKMTGDGGKKVWKTYRMESSRFGRVLFQIAASLLFLGVIAFLARVGWSWPEVRQACLDAAPFVAGGITSWVLGFRHDAKLVMRGELYSERFPKLYKGLKPPGKSEEGDDSDQR